MADASSWSSSTPLGTSLIRDFDDLYRTDKSILEASLEEEHDFTGSPLTAGKHKLGSARVYVGLAAGKTAAAEEGRVFFATDTDTLFVHDGTTQTEVKGASHTHPWADVVKTSSSLADLATRSAGDLDSGTLLSARLVGAYTGITGLGTLTSLNVSGTITAGDYSGIDWAHVSKVGSSLADLATRSAADLSSGTLASARLVGAYTGITGLGTLTSLNVSGTITAGGYSGITWAHVSKVASSLADLATRSAADLSSGTLASARLVGAYTGITGLGTLTGLTVSGAITSTRATASGPPFVVSSTANVANLNADTVDGQHASDLLTSAKSQHVGFKGASVYDTTGVLSGGKCSWTTERFDVGGCWSSGAPTRMTAPVTGYYLVTATVHLNGGTTEDISIYINGVESGYVAGGDGNSILHVSGVVSLSAGGYVEIGTTAADVNGNHNEFGFALLGVP